MVATVAVLAAGLAAWWWWGQSEPVPWDKPATVDGATITLTYVGSECRAGADAKVAEDSERVVVTIEETVRARTCSHVGVSHEIEIELWAPLGDRKLVDGACELDEHAAAGTCAGQTTARR